MNFPLFHRPGSVVFLDDDPDYLEMLALVLPRHWHVRLFLHPEDCIAHLNREPPFWEADAWAQQEIIQHWHAGRPLVPQILDYWSRSTERYALTRVCVFDYSMPAMDGLQALSRLQDWPGSRVLLTGQADDQVAIDAFNAGLIQQFVPKQTADLSARLLDVVERLLAAPHASYAQVWRATLKPEQVALLREPAIARQLAALAAARQWVEHVVIGDPFGVLGLDAAGSPGWLQLETAVGVSALAELTQMEGMDAAVVADVRAGRKLASLEISQALRQPVAVADAVTLDAAGKVFAAWFPLQGVSLAGAVYGTWLGRQPPRRIH